MSPKTYIVRVPCEFWFAAIVKAESEEQAIIVARERARKAGWAIASDRLSDIENLDEMED